MRFAPSYICAPPLHLPTTSHRPFYQDVSALARCPALHTLHLNKCAEVRDVSALGYCPSLRLLNLRCSGAVHVPCRDNLRVEFDKPTEGSAQPILIIIST
jgi:hypothetical protein